MMMGSTTVDFHPKEKKPAKVFLRVDDAHAEAWVEGEITEGAIGIEVNCEIRGQRWDNLTKMVVVSDGQYGWKLMIEDGKCEIPHEALRGGEMLLLGVDGWDADGKLRIPTILAGACFVQKSVAGLEPKDPLPPSPDITARILAAAERALAIAADIENRADNHEFDGFSPTIEVIPIPGGYQLKITDVTGVRTVDIIGSGYDDTEVRKLISERMTKHILDYDGTHIKEDGENLTFAALYEMLMEKPVFCVLVYNNYAYHPNGVSQDQIVFSGEYPVNGYDRAHRITMLANGTVTAAETESEHTSSRVNAITEANEGSTVQYPSVKATADYVKPIKQGLSQLQNTGDTPVPEGKVWGSTALGAGWVDQQGGGGGTWETLINTTLEEVTDYVTVNVNGQIDKIVAMADVQPAEGNISSRGIGIDVYLTNGQYVEYLAQNLKWDAHRAHIITVTFAPTFSLAQMAINATNISNPYEGATVTNSFSSLHSPASFVNVYDETVSMVKFGGINAATGARMGVGSRVIIAVHRR